MSSAQAQSFFVSEDQKLNLRAKIAEGHAVLGSQISYLNLEKYQKILGNAWNRFKQAIFAVSRKVISALVGDDCLIVELDTKIILFFFDKSEDEANKLSSRISSEIDKALKGDDQLADKNVSCRTSRIPTSSIHSALTSEGPTSHAQTKSEAREQILFTPLFVATIGALYGSFCISTKQVNRAPTDIDQASEKTCDATKKRDFAVFEKALMTVYKLTKTKRPQKVLFSLDYRNLCNDRFLNDYEITLKQAPSKLTHLLVPRLANIPSGASSETLERISVLIHSIFPNVALEVSFSDRSQILDIHHDTRHSITSVSMQDIQRVFDDESRVIDALRHLIDQTHHYKRRLLIYGVDETWEKSTLTGSGVDIVSGNALSPPSATPPAFKQIDPC